MGPEVGQQEELKYGSETEVCFSTAGSRVSNAGRVVCKNSRVGREGKPSLHRINIPMLTILIAGTAALWLLTQNNQPKPIPVKVKKS